MTAVIDDTYAEAFKSLYTEFLDYCERSQMGRSCS